MPPKKKLVKLKKSKSNLSNGGKVRSKSKSKSGSSRKVVSKSKGRKTDRKNGVEKQLKQDRSSDALPDVDPGARAGPDEEDIFEVSDDEEPGMPAPAHMPPVVRQDTLPSMLQPGWVKLIDAASSLPYYYNQDKGEVTWDPPLKAEFAHEEDQKMHAGLMVVDSADKAAQLHEPVPSAASVPSAHPKANVEPSVSRRPEPSYSRSERVAHTYLAQQTGQSQGVELLPTDGGSLIDDIPVFAPVQQQSLFAPGDVDDLGTTAPSRPRRNSDPLVLCPICCPCQFVFCFIPFCVLCLPRTIAQVFCGPHTCVSQCEQVWGDTNECMKEGCLYTNGF